MKTIGILGGMSWESTALYYQIINKEVAAQMGGLHSAKIILHSVDFEEIKNLQYKGEWDKAGNILAAHAKNLQNSGADFIVIATNTMHKVAPQIEKNITIPVLHIATATALQLKKDKIKRVGLLGTKFTMEQSFYTDMLKTHSILPLVPDEEERQVVHDIIYKELCHGIIKKESEEKYQKTINNLKAAGAQAVILGCTEICMLVKQSALPLYDTTLLHARAAAWLSLN